MILLNSHLWNLRHHICVLLGLTLLSSLACKPHASQDAASPAKRVLDVSLVDFYDIKDPINSPFEQKGSSFTIIPLGALDPVKDPFAATFVIGEFQMEAMHEDEAATMGEFRRAGIEFKAKGTNLPGDIARGLALEDSYVKAIEMDGAVAIILHPGRPLAVPTNRHDPKYNAEYVEGGFTKAGLQEWVTPNTPLPNDAQVFRILPDGTTVEHRYFAGKWYEKTEWDQIIADSVRRKALLKTYLDAQAAASAAAR